MLSIVFKEISDSLTPPQVTNSLLFAALPFTLNSEEKSLFNKLNSCFLVNDAHVMELSHPDIPASAPHKRDGSGTRGVL